MSKTLDRIDDDLAAWIRRQTVFFVATAPLSGDGHINCSPKGGDCLRVLGDNEVAYQDLTGSGVETIAHLRENGRIVLVLCAFDGPPQIVRLHGRGRAVHLNDPEYVGLAMLFPENPGARAIIRVTVDRLSTSCGWKVPLMDYRAERDALDRWAQQKGPDGLQEYRATKNAASIDGLPGLNREGIAEAVTP